MRKTMAALWNGEIAPFHELGKHNSELKHLEKLMRRNLEELCGDKSLQLYDKCNDCICEYIGLCTQIAFSDGFGLGVKLTAEAFCNETPTE